MSQTLSRWKAVLLGLVVVGLIAFAAFTLTRAAGKQGLWAETTEVTVAFPETHDLAPGTPVRIRGVDAGKVIAIEYPDHDGDGAAVTVRMQIDAKYAPRLYADASAQIHSTGLLGAKVISIRPGNPSKGPLADGCLAAKETPDITVAAAKIGDTADEAKLLIKEVRTGNGTLSKLLQDDKLYTEMTGLAVDSRKMVKRADSAVGTVEEKSADVDKFVKDGRATLQSVKQGTDAVQKLPLIRSYVTDAAAILVRPDYRRELVTYSTADLFETDTSILTPAGREHLDQVAAWLKGLPNDKSEVVIAALCDPGNVGQTPSSAGELTKKQADGVVEYLKGHKAFKTGLVSSRKVTPLGMGQGPSPVIEKGLLPPSYLQVLVYTPQ